MSTRKIIFFVVATILLIGIIFGAWRLSQSKEQSKNIASELNIWVVGDASEWFDPIIEWFKAKYPAYKKTNIVVTKFWSYDEYQKTLLSVLADGSGPDIFVVDKWKDAILESKIIPIPEEFISIDDFYKRYDPIFLDTLIQEEQPDDKSPKVTSLYGIPLWYETLWVFYNKSIYPNIITTWPELDLQYLNNANPEILPAGIGLGPRYVQYGGDIVWLFLSYESRSYKEMGKNSKGIESYAKYSSASSATTNTPEEWVTQEPVSATSLKEQMNQDNLTMTDLFVRGKVGMIFWFPSLIREIEYAKKRAWSEATNQIILTSPMLKRASNSPVETIGRYYYFAVSKGTKSPSDALNFLLYLTTEEAEAKYLEAFPYYIAAQTSFQEAQKNTSLSPSFTRAKLWSFIDQMSKKTVFDYGIWSEFALELEKILDTNDNANINNRLERLSKKITCQIDQGVYQVNIGVNCSENP